MMCIWLFLVPCLDPLLHKLKLECGWKHPLHRLHRWIYQGLEDLRVWLCRLDSKSLSKGLGSLCLPKHCNVRQVFDCRELYCPFGTFWSPNYLCFSFVNELIVLWRIYFAPSLSVFFASALICCTSVLRIYVNNTGVGQYKWFCKPECTDGSNGNRISHGWPVSARVPMLWFCSLPRCHCILFINCTPNSLPDYALLPPIMSVDNT